MNEWKQYIIKKFPQTIKGIKGKRKERNSSILVCESNEEEQENNLFTYLFAWFSKVFLRVSERLQTLQKLIYFYI